MADEDFQASDYQREKVRIYRMLYEILAELKKTFIKYGFKEEKIIELGAVRVREEAEKFNYRKKVKSSVIRSLQLFFR